MTIRFSSRAARVCYALLIWVGLLCVSCTQATALKHQQNGTGSAVHRVGQNEIVADGSPYHLDWNGKQGTLTYVSLVGASNRTYSLTYLHTDPGPQGYAQHLAWFIARDETSFMLLWCYLNDSGRDFWCWMYSYPANEMTTHRFTGTYRFTPLSEPLPETVQSPFHLDPAPGYVGPDFAYRAWTHRSGELNQLGLYPALPLPNADSPAPESPLTNSVTRTLSQLKVSPLHEIKVGSGNGWRTGGWRELHTIATDSLGDPYYMILYSNSPRGFVVDLKRGQTFTADFGQKVNFTGDTSSVSTSGSNIETDNISEIFVHRFDRHEIVLTSTQPHGNPYLEADLSADIVSPSGEKWLILGFWDGGNTWKLRIAPTSVGTWTWHTHSIDPDLNDKVGAFECVTDTGTERGFVKVNPLFGHTFMYSDNTPFFPTAVRIPVGYTQAGMALPAATGTVTNTSLQSVPPTDQPVLNAFAAFERKVDASARAGFNFWLGNYVLDEPAFSQHTQRNEGGEPFLDAGLTQLNPAYFQWMDKRIAYCNEKGIVPDVGLGWPGHNLFTAHSEAILRTLWRYVLARYSAYNITWNLFGRDASPFPAIAERRISDFGELTRRYNPYGHPVTLLTTDPPHTTRAAEPTPPPSDPENPMMFRRRHVVIPPPQDPAYFADEKWLDVICDYGTNPNVLLPNTRLDKPLLWWDANPMSQMEGEIRQRIWQTRMLGAYWIAGPPAAEPSRASELRATAICASLFKRTRYWRIHPRPDLIGRPVDTGRSVLATRAQPLPADPNTKTVAWLLADPGWEYILYLPHGGTQTLDLLEATGHVKMGWYNPRTGEFVGEETIVGGTYVNFTAPDTDDWVLYVSRR